MEDPRNKTPSSDQDATQPSAETSPAPADEGPAGDQTEEWVLTLNSFTGELCKAERLDRASGRRQEVSAIEYAAMGGQAADPDSEHAMLVQQLQEAHAQQSLYEAGYHHGLADYEAMLAAHHQASGAHQAAQEYEAALTTHGYLAGYHQASIDYETALAGTMATPGEHRAYLQGMNDFAARHG